MNELEIKWATEEINEELCEAGYNDAQISKIHYKAYEDGHSDGEEAVFYKLLNLKSFLLDLKSVESTIKYTISVTQEYWVCGDGCCSDSWSLITLKDSNGHCFCEDMETRLINVDYSSEENIMDYLNELYSLKLNSQNCVIKR